MTKSSLLLALAARFRLVGFLRRRFGRLLRGLGLRLGLCLALGRLGLRGFGFLGSGRRLADRLFGVFQQEDSEAHNDKLPNIPDWDEQARLASEKEILGFFISGHPLEKYKDKLQDLQALSIIEIAAMTKSTGKDETIPTAGIITNLRVLKSKKGDFYAQGTLEDMTGACDLLVFPEAYKRLAEKLKMEVPVLIRGGVRIEEGANPKITVGDITPLEEAQPRFDRVFQVKRLQPGELDGGVSTASFGHVVPAATHDCSTLGGNSGSAILDLETGALGLRERTVRAGCSERLLPRQEPSECADHAVRRGPQHD